MSTGIAPLALPAAQFLFTRIGETVSDYWTCRDCLDGGFPTEWPHDEAIAHVTETGHTVVIYHIRETILTGVRY